MYIYFKGPHCTAPLFHFHPHANFFLKNIYLPLQTVSFMMHAFDQITSCIYCSLCLMLNEFLDPKRMISKILRAA